LPAAKAFRSERISISFVNPILNIIGSNTVRFDFIKKHAEEIMKASLIHFIKNTKLGGSLFNPEDTSRLVSIVDTDFWVDHTEQLEALAWAREIFDWPLGGLHDGHEFLLVI
jgi:hypothetical protein